MNFFLAEVVALDLDKDQKMIENIAKLIAGAATEEEKDLANSQEKGSNTTSEIDILLFVHHERSCPGLASLTLTFDIYDGAKPINHFKETVNPPPEA
jgi:hypothetical protein